MPIKKETEPWVINFRQLLKASLHPGAQWFVSNSRGQMRLEIKEGGAKQSRILPFEWNQKAAASALPRLQQIYKNYIKSKGQKTLAQACALTEVSSSKHQVDWDDLISQYRKFVPNASDKTWTKSYLPVLRKAGSLMRQAKSKPLDGEHLMMKALNQWQQGSRSRQIARRSLKGFLDWAVLRGNLIAAYAPPAHIPETRTPKQIGYAISDEQILYLLESIPKGRHPAEVETYNSWKFAIQLCTVYGLRPEELRHLYVEEGPEGKELWTSYQKSKGGTKGNRTEPRKLHPLFVRTPKGPIDWQLLNRFEIEEKLPPLGQEGKGGEALGTFLKRRKYWSDLKIWIKKKKIKQVLKPYTFRHRYAKESHAAGFPIANICKAMGHSIEVHLGNYARFTPDGTADLYAKRNKAAKAACKTKVF
ncbi:site-specific integrase [Prochlorococcus sp. MIT 1223]|uniref:site-specific integrase n=1 Tax=Prochlorococcus sp. MIT 1223 TaxID=3096217 RepID=UPI002A757F4F|nr:site-specific integrase [Prochlorococcus sp. MIT 1223]